MASEAKKALWDTAPRCGFYVRREVTGTLRMGGGNLPSYEFEMVPQIGPDAPHVRLIHPPVVGDLVYLHDENGVRTGTHRVVERSWHHAVQGSMDWPVTERRPQVGPLLYLICEKDTGPFRDEAQD